MTGQNVLQVDEILRHILSLVTNSSCHDRPTLYAAAQVNSLWSSVALDILWADISLRDWYHFLGIAHTFVSRVIVGIDVL